MFKHRSIKTSKSRKTETSNNLSTFFTTILPFIERLESEDKILLVLPTDKDNPTQGIVCSEELTLMVNADYLQRMADYTRQCGSLEAYYDFRARNPKWAAKHNPDQLLLNICRAARLVIAYRYGLALGNAEYLSNDAPEPVLSQSKGYDNDNSDSSNNRNAEKSSLSSSLSLDESPLFITMMGSLPDTGRAGGEAVPQSIGYELAGSITLEEYKEKKSEEVSLVES